MSIEVKVPGLPESVSDATIVNWRKQPGDSIERDESLVDLETDKVVLEVPSPIKGVVTEILEQEGAVVEAGQLLATLTEDLSAANIAKESSNVENETIITPSAKKMMAEKNINEKDVMGSGKGGRVLKEDVIAYLQQGNGPIEKHTSEVKEKTNNTSKPVLPNVVEHNVGERIEKRVPMTRLRARIAERLIDVQQNSAILTTFNEVNMQPVMDLRNKYKDLFFKKYDVKLGFMSFFIWVLPLLHHEV